MSGGLKIRTGWRATNSSDQIFRGIDVTATCGSSKPITSGQHRHAAPFPDSSVADLERHRSCKSDYVSANLTGGSIPFQHSLHSVTAAFFVVNEAVPGQNRLREPFYVFRAQDKEPSQRSAKPHYPVQVWGARPSFHRIRESQPFSLGLGPRHARGSTGVSDHFYWSVA